MTTPCGPGTDFADLRRVGAFHIAHELVRQAHKPVWSSLMSRVIILRAESMIADDSIHYVALCDDFAAIDLGGPIPEYNCIIARDIQTAMDVERYITRFIPVTSMSSPVDSWQW